MSALNDPQDDTCRATPQALRLLFFPAACAVDSVSFTAALGACGPLRWARALQLLWHAEEAVLVDVPWSCQWIMAGCGSAATND